MPVQIPLVHARVNDRWEVAVTMSEGQFQQVSFVNSICTMRGGEHPSPERAPGLMLRASPRASCHVRPALPCRALTHTPCGAPCHPARPVAQART